MGGGPRFQTGGGQGGGGGPRFQTGGGQGGGGGPHFQTGGGQGGGAPHFQTSGGSHFQTGQNPHTYAPGGPGPQQTPRSFTGRTPDRGQTQTYAPTGGRPGFGPSSSRSGSTGAYQPNGRTPRLEAAGAPHRGFGPGGAAPRHSDSGRTFTYGGRSHPRFEGARYRYPRGLAYHHYLVGHRFPHEYWVSEYYITDYVDYGLGPPPDDYQWIRYGPDIVLVDMDTGEIAQAVYGAFDQDPGPPDDSGPPPDQGPDQGGDPDQGGPDQGPPNSGDSAAAAGNAGLQALNAGDFDTAVSQFSVALDSGQLSDEDQEFALAGRGRAYLKKGDLSSAIADLDRARRGKPDDADAQNDLVAALTAKLPPVTAIPGMPKPSFWGSLGRALLEGAVAGVVSGLTGDSQ
jgi:Ni/Co efflux regulator RcnB